MSDSAWVHPSASAIPATRPAPRHSTSVRITHWITALCFLALCITGIEIVISHPRFYWGETGNALTRPLFQLPIPASRETVPTGYNFVLPDQNGWSRSLHFQAAWFVVFTGIFYALTGFITRHFQENLLPPRSELNLTSFSKSLASHFRFDLPNGADGASTSYNLLQRLTYLSVVFLLFPLMIWTGLAMSPSVVSAFPAVVTVFGGHQSARTIHFFVFLFLVLFVLVHIVMVYRGGFRERMGAMVTGRAGKWKGHS